MRAVLHNFTGALRRVFPAAMTDAQAIAFSMFLAFFPMLLFALGLLAFSPRLSSAAQEFLSDLRLFLPQDSKRMVMDFLVHQGQGRTPQGWILLGLGGTLLGGSQVMGGFMQAFRNLYTATAGSGVNPPLQHFWRDQLRALLLLLATIGPLLAAIILTVFGRQLRTWMIVHYGLPKLFDGIWLVVYVGLALVSAMLVLALLYRVGRAGCRSWNDVMPGAVVATLLWWVVNSAFGFYVRNVPYSLVYGGLAAAIGLLVWMNLCAIVVLLGAAYNAEALSRRP
ncbi:MAG: YihY/virulence factor BrkB family protein [Acidobacteria bacterium]|nr:YihY/virulence factor BrkB family protein [Acidobacteriota bacterium]MBI3664539.1 YihY/virulence factor BrkB family protein [Acidobacteriota bacterium]